MTNAKLKLTMKDLEDIVNDRLNDRFEEIFDDIKISI